MTIVDIPYITIADMPYITIAMEGLNTCEFCNTSIAKEGTKEACISDWVKL